MEARYLEDKTHERERGAVQVFPFPCDVSSAFSTLFDAVGASSPPENPETPPVVPEKRKHLLLAPVLALVLSTFKGNPHDPVCCNAGATETMLLPSPSTHYAIPSYPHPPFPPCSFVRSFGVLTAFLATAQPIRSSVPSTELFIESTPEGTPAKKPFSYNSED